MNVTVILCTYNRCESLATALESLAASVVPAGVEWETLVVDNNSKDQTRTVVEDFSRRHPGRFRYLFEPRQGKSNALNSGIRESRGEILAFVDDDITVEPAWLHNLTSVLHGSPWAGSGGRILPPPGFVPPGWLALNGPRNLGIALCAQFDFGAKPGELRDAPFGTNMAFRRGMFAKYGDFRTDLGPRPGSEIRNEDTEFGRRLMTGGERLCYAPAAVVYHEIRPERVRKEFFLAWWFDRGRGAVLENSAMRGVRQILRIFARAVPTTMLWFFTFNPQRRFYRQCMIWYATGKIAELRRQSRWPDDGAGEASRQRGNA